ncbi:MAG: hypothetical protein AAF226_00635 [Verrucomicrobiota bacterium]
MNYSNSDCRSTTTHFTIPPDRYQYLRELEEQLKAERLERRKRKRAEARLQAKEQRNL